MLFTTATTITTAQKRLATPHAYTPNGAAVNKNISQCFGFEAVFGGMGKMRRK